MNGKIVAISHGSYSVLANGNVYNVSSRGKFRSQSCHPVVGDNVEIDINDLVINEVLPRTSYLKRPVIANIDQMIIVESLVKPEFSYLLAFKYLTYANMNNIPAKIILTKSDEYLDDKELENIIKTFSILGIDIYVISNKTKDGLELAKDIFVNKTSCLIGQTGVGKSSLLNAIDPSFQRNIGEYSKALHRGKHETKEIVLLPFHNGYIADTPGFSSLELDLYKEDLAHFFPGFTHHYLDCYYPNCLHLSENKCAIKKEIEKGNIPPIAYEIYQKLSSEAKYYIKRY